MPKKVKSWNGLSVISERAYKMKEKRETKPIKVTVPFPLDCSCRHGDIDRCQVHCGACVCVGGFEKLPKTATYLV